MNCPQCNIPLNNIQYEYQELDACKKCGGMWFDKGELLDVIDSMLLKNKVDDQSAEEAFKGSAGVREVHQNNRTCPKCHVGMRTFNYGYDSNVFLDKCSSCEGIWTDRGELKAVAQHIKGNPNMDNYAKALIHTLNKYPQKSKISIFTALSIATGYLIFACYGGGEAFIKTRIFLFLPLACIFYGKEMGDMTGVRFRLTFAAPLVTKPTPGAFVEFIGWVLLLMPLVAGILSFIFK
jgi:Zn-finger nucleic acid-binding protein